MEDQAAENRFAQYRDYYDELLSYLTFRLRSRDQAMDVTQETFLRVLAQDSTAPIRQPRAFLYKTAVNITLDLFRRKQRWPEQSLETTELQRCFVAPARQEAQVEANEQIRRLHVAIRELPPRRRDVFLLHLFKERSHAEIAAQFGISKSMVEKHIMKATVYCRKRLLEA